MHWYSSAGVLAALLVPLGTTCLAQEQGVKDMVVIIKKDCLRGDAAQKEKLTTDEGHMVEVLVASGLGNTRKFVHMDARTLDKMRKDEIFQAMIRGDETKIPEIEKKYRVDVVVSTSGSAEACAGIGGYYLANSKIVMACLRTDEGILFDEAASESQTGFYGMPEWVGLTETAARENALKAAVASVFDEAGLPNVVPYPPQLRIKLDVAECGRPEGAEFFPAHALSGKEAKALALDMVHTMGKRDKVSCAVLDTGKRMAAIGILSVDIDLQRGRRLDTSELQIFDYRKRRHIKTFELPRDVKGVRSPKSRKIVNCAFAPSGRFLAIVSEHPVFWIYDVWSGQMLVTQHLGRKAKPVATQFSRDCKYVLIETGRGERYLRLTSGG